ncbi:MAG TPA: BCCT family transporter, partial [Ferrovibrio sp.]|uniref:BCCT family transporter n=1 Tax=Ferrovibrio sp. TaxID=1917215 RepID=UPI002B4B4B6E
MSVNRRVFWPAAIISLLFVLLAVLFTEPMAQRVAGLQDFIVTRFGWFYILSVTGFLIFALYLFVSPYGSIRLGADDDEPEYSYPSWFAMLFSAGMGIGILFYGVAEPVLHYAKPPASLGPGMQPETIESAKEAIHLAYFHWGLHAWAVYIIVGLALAYFAYRHDLPLTIRSTLWPLLGERIHGPAGDIVDILAIFGTLFGLATSLGLGVLQVNAGLDYLGLMSTGLTNQIWLIVGITLAATLSVASGLDNGIKRLSEINLGLALLLLLFVFILGPTVFLVSTLIENIGYYLQTLVGTSFRTTAFRGTEWQKSWTMFYWGWWISWAPFVGMFIARISRGRTIREFVGGVLFAPTLLTFVWFGVFGNTALHREIFGAGGMVEAVDADVATAIYVLLDQLPWPTISSALAAILVATFFVTSADSGALVMDIISSNGNPQPGLPGRIFWALSSGAIAIVLLMVGGLTALQTAAITTALPFACIMILMCWSVYRGLHAERRRRRRLPEMETAGQGAAAPGRTGDWRSRLGSILG